MQDKARHRPETFTPRAANTQGPCFKKSPHLFRPLFPPNSSTKGFLHVNFLTALLTQGNQPISLNYPSQNWTTAQSNIHIVRLSEWIDSSLCFSLMGTNPLHWNNYRTTVLAAKTQCLFLSHHFCIAWEIPTLSASTPGQVIKRKGMALKCLSFHPI